MSIIISEDLKRILLKIENVSSIAKILVDGAKDTETKTNEINYLDISHTDPFKISYITKDRIEKIKEEYKDSTEERIKNVLVWKKKRYHTKPGKIINKILNIENGDVERFVNLYKGLIERRNTNVSIIEGKKIIPYFHESKYEECSGSLGSSCMRYIQSQKLLDLYAYNDCIKMAVIFSKKEPDKIVGRALLWETDDGYKIMDRLYLTKEKYEIIFNEWAKENGYYRKLHNNWYDTVRFISPDGKKVEIETHVQLDKYKYMDFPYLDTFKWLDSRNGKLYNYLPDFNDKNYLCLIKTDGGYSAHDILLFDVINRIYLPFNNVRWLKYMNGFTNKNQVVYSSIYDDNIYIKHAVKDVILNDYIFNDKEYKNDNKKIRKTIILKIKKMKDDGILNMTTFRVYKNYVENLKKNEKGD